MAAGDAVLLTSQFAAAGLFLLLAAVLLAVKFNSRVNRAFAIFLLLRGAALLLQAFGRVPAYSEDAALLFAFGRYFVLATPFLLLYFVVLYRVPQGGLVVRVAGIAAILLTVVVETLFLLDHCVVQCVDNPGQNGFLTPLVQAIPLAEGLAGLLLALAAKGMDDVPRRKATLVVASSLALLGLLEGAQVVSILLNRGSDTFTAVDSWLAVARVGLLLGFIAAVAAVAALSTVLQRRANLMLIGASLVVVATTLYYLRLEEQGASQALSLTTALFGTWRLLAAALVAYALVRHRFLDLDLRINWTISRGTVLGIFVATFVIVSQIAENQLDQKLGVVFGGVATGVMLLALRPLERLGDRIADGLHPRGRADKAKDERIALFQEQAIMVWEDGHIGRKERMLLDNLREKLQIPADVAARIEHEAARQVSPAKTSAPLSTRS